MCLLPLLVTQYYILYNSPITAPNLLMKHITLFQITLISTFGILSIQAEDDSIANKKYLQHDKVVGNGKCLECHESEIAAWKTTKHFKSKDLHKNKDAMDIARKMGLTSAAKISTSKLCSQCHFTNQKIGSSPAKAISGVSCESCHGGAKDWIEVHNTGDRRESKDTAAAKAKRVASATSHGMLYPNEIHKVADNCYSCHIVTNEKLVNVGGHAVGSKSFDLSAWASGEVRHNFFKDTKKNAPTPQNRKRMFYLVGLTLDLEYSLRGVARATEKGEYGNSMGRRASYKRKQVSAAIKALGDAAPEELKKINELASAKGLIKYFNTKPLETAAEAISVQTKAMAEKHDGSKFSALDALIPTESKGKAFHP